MKFLKYIDNLKESFSNNIMYTENNVCLLGPYEDRPPVAEHIIFPPMTDALIQHLKESYNRTVPVELLSVFKAANGMDLFWTLQPLEGTEYILPVSQLTIYGIPLTYTRDRLEPYNISIEDLSRLRGTPDNWLKFGSHRESANGENQGEDNLFVDTDNGKVYSANREGKTSIIHMQWDSIDSCLCDLFEKLVCTQV